MLRNVTNGTQYYGLALKKEIYGAAVDWAGVALGLSRGIFRPQADRDNRAVKTIIKRTENGRMAKVFDQCCRSTIFFLMFPMALAGFRPLGQVLVQFMMV